jgi:5-methyltetrahydrofolate--homocysteine methyltransferase
MHTELHSRSHTVLIGPDQPFVMIGERINPSGRKKLGALMVAGDFSLVRLDAVAQVAAGAQVLDVNAGYPGGDEGAMLKVAVRVVQQATEAPLSIDSSVPEALEAALAVYQGKALVNSVTAEDDRLERILPLVRKHGAAVIGMAHDESGISHDPRERLASARKIFDRANDHGIPPADVVIDPLCLALAAEPRSVLIALETMRLIREELGANMCCGASNISFGLPDRGPLNAAFLPVAMSHGLTAAILDVTNSVIREAVFAGELLFARDEYAAQWIARYREKQKAAADLAAVR